MNVTLAPNPPTRDPAPADWCPLPRARQPRARPPRLAWRAIVRTRGREGERIEWHLAHCTAPTAPQAHCPEGRRRLAAAGDPAGHCLRAATCPVCAEHQV